MLRMLNRLAKPALVLGMALLLSHGAEAQPGKRGKEPAAKEETKASPELEAWITTLTEKMTDRQDSIRDSARAALVSVGKPALPVLQKLVDGKDSAMAEAAKQVIARIEGTGRGGFGRGGFGGPGGGPGGFGRGGFGGPGGGERGGPGGGGDRGPGGRGGDQPRGPGGAALGGNEQLFKDLNLTDKQKTKVDDILAAQKKKWTEMLEKLRDGKLEVGQMREAIEKARADFVKDVKGVLTKEQFEKFEKAFNEEGRGSGSRDPRDPRGGRPDRSID